MKNLNRMIACGASVLNRAALAGALALSMAATAYAAPSWPQAPYSYYAENDSLQTVLRDFAAGFSLSAQIGRNVAGVVNGRFNTGTPSEFLDRLGGVYGFTWFVHAGTLYVSHASEVTTASVSAQGGSISSLRQALSQLGVLDERFGWGEMPEQGVALVSGPPAYVALVRRTVAALPLGDSGGGRTTPDNGGQQVAVFRLRHASVNDRTISYRDTQVVTPGLASVLRDLISGSGVNNDTLAAVAEPLRQAQPLFSEAESMDGVTPNAPPASPAPARGQRTLEPTIQADTRLNAIIVQDIPERIPLYRQLIEQLDVPSTLIEIEAMIVDVNSDRVDELGVDWGAQAGTSTFGYGNLNLAPSNGLPLANGIGFDPGTIGLSVGNALVARIRALQGRGDANILSQPSILTSDNLGALIDLSETFYIRTQGERVATVTPITVGTSLRVTPRHIDTGGNDRVELTVDIEDGSIQNEFQVDNLPTVRRSNISTLAVVGDGQTLLIGGYNSTQDSTRTDKVPVLGDIPGLGALFSHRSQSLQQRERLFLIRPRIVAVNGELIAPDMTGAGALGNAAYFVDEAQSRRSRGHVGYAPGSAAQTLPVPAGPAAQPVRNAGSASSAATIDPAAKAVSNIVVKSPGGAAQPVWSPARDWEADLYGGS